MEFKRISFIISIVSILSAGCATISKAPFATTTPQPSVTLFPTVTLFSTSTPRPTPSSTITLTSTPESTLLSDWFPIPRLTNPEPVDFSVAHLFKGLKVPPLPDELVIEFATGQPYGEVPPETIFYQLYLIRKGNTRMLWLGIPFKETVACCGWDTPHRIYDSIPFPPIETESLLIPFTCIQKQGWDIFLIVVAEPPENGAVATNILYAWRIDSATTTLQPVPTQGIECSPYY